MWKHLSVKKIIMLVNKCTGTIRYFMIIDIALIYVDLWNICRHVIAFSTFFVELWDILSEINLLIIIIFVDKSQVYERGIYNQRLKAEMHVQHATKVCYFQVFLNLFEVQNKYYIIYFGIRWHPYFLSNCSAVALKLCPSDIPFAT